MALTFEVDPAYDRSVRDGIVALWVDVSNAGGAVG
ncbi:GNAT family N-acetyltransferase, partial [Streptomyces albidoflavus]